MYCSIFALIEVSLVDVTSPNEATFETLLCRHLLISDPEVKYMAWDNRHSITT